MALNQRSSSPIHLNQNDHEDPFIPTSGPSFERLLNDSLHNFKHSGGEPHNIKKVFKKMQPINIGESTPTTMVLQRNKFQNGLRTVADPSSSEAEEERKPRQFIRKNVTPTPSSIETDLSTFTLNIIEKNNQTVNDYNSHVSFKRGIAAPGTKMQKSTIEFKAEDLENSYDIQHVARRNRIE